jgi:hypothetical protein
MVPFFRGKEEEVRIKVAMMIAMVVVLVTLLGSATTALAQQVIGGAIQCQSTPALPQEPTRSSSSGSATGCLTR